MTTTPSTGRLRRAGTIRTVTVGDLKISYVPDGAVQLSPDRLLPDTTEATWRAQPEYLDHTGNLVGSIGALLVEHGERAMLIDAGFGPQEVPAQPGNLPGRLHGGALLDNLARLGRRPDEIEAVAFTHLHIDHLGWAWHDAGRAAFTAAEYLVAEPEWSQRHLAEQHGTPAQILDRLAAKVRTVADAQQIFPGVRVRLAPGHTAGHAAFEIASGRRRVIAFGDALHSPIQIGHPDWSAAFDHDPARAARTRHRLVSELAQPDTIGFGIHFADVVFGRAVVGDDGVTWSPQA